MTKMNEPDRQLMDLFVQEVKERASEMEHNLLAMDNADTPEDKRNLQQRLLRIAHSLKGAAGLMEVRPVEAICHRMEDLLAAVASQDRVLVEPELDLMLVAADAIAEAANKLETGEALSEASFGDVLKLLETGMAREAEGPQAEGTASTSKSHGAAFPLIRVSDTDGSLLLSADRLDALLYRSGELTASRARIRLRAELSLSLRERARRLRSVKAPTSEEAAGIESGLRELAAGLVEDSRFLYRSVGALSREVRRARIQPFSEVCQGLSRMIREIGRESGKSAELLISDGEIEIDRSILAGLKDALRHLVRNA
ncbi:MAG: hybrid sensor histidine kinase/response regulator, partial [Mesorhizobium sp.]